MGRHRDPGTDPAARPGGVRKYKKGRSRQLRPIHHPPDESKRKRRVFLQLFKCYKNTRHGADNRNRTCTSVTLDPKTSASASSAISARCIVVYQCFCVLSILRQPVRSRHRLALPFPLRFLQGRAASSAPRRFHPSQLDQHKQGSAGRLASGCLADSRYKGATRLLRTPAALVDLGLIDHFCFGDLVNKISIDRVQMDQRPHFGIEEIVKKVSVCAPTKTVPLSPGKTQPFSTLHPAPDRKWKFHPPSTGHSSPRSLQPRPCRSHHRIQFFPWHLPPPAQQQPERAAWRSASSAAWRAASSLGRTSRSFCRRLFGCRLRCGLLSAIRSAQPVRWPAGGNRPK